MQANSSFSYREKETVKKRSRRAESGSRARKVVVQAPRMSMHDRRFTCCIEILGDNRLAWVMRTLSVKINLPAVWLLVSNVVNQAYRSRHDDPSFLAAFSFFFQISFLVIFFLKKETLSIYFILNASVILHIAFLCFFSCYSFVHSCATFVTRLRKTFLLSCIL